MTDSPPGKERRTTAGCPKVGAVLNASGRGEGGSHKALSWDRPQSAPLCFNKQEIVGPRDLEVQGSGLRCYWIQDVWVLPLFTSPRLRPGALALGCSLNSLFP